MEALPKLFTDYKEILVFLLQAIAIVGLWRAWYQERVERNKIQEERIADFRGPLEENTKAQTAVAEAGRAQAENYERLRQEVISSRARSRQ
jgi:membrane protein implicated in regulation of membrane protease activity